MFRRAIKVVVVTMFEPGGGKAGELTHLRKHLGLRPWKLAGFPPGMLWHNGEGVAAIVAGVGPVNTAVNVLTLGLCARVDWRQAYWLVCGIAGGNPKVCSLGSPIFADWVVDGDLAYDLHPADHPPEWPTGLLPLGARRPFGRTGLSTGLFGQPAQVFQLNPKLSNWAQRLTHNVPLADTAELAAARQAYTAFPHGARIPAIGVGVVLSAARYWHGARHQAWAERWVKYWTQGQGQFFTASMEDSGTLGALRQLHRLKLADWQRVLVLRSVSNFTVPPPGRAAHEHLTGKSPAGVNYPALPIALENGRRIATTIITGLLKKS